MSAADWDEIAGRHYRKREIYEVEWMDENGKELNLSDHIVCGCPFGGPIAMILKEHQYSQNTDNIQYLRIFTSSAKLISRFKWRHRGLLKLGWSAEEHLIVILENATVIIYDIFGKQLRNFSMGTECEHACLADAYIWSKGLVVRTAGDFFQFWAIMSLMDDDEESFQLCNPDLEQPPIFMTCVNPDIIHKPFKSQFNRNINNNQRSNSMFGQQSLQDIQVLISTVDNGIYCISRSKRTCILEHDCPIHRMAISSNGKFIAVYDEKHNLIVSTRDFKQASCTFQVKVNTFPIDMQWCDRTSTVLLYKNQIILAAENEFIPYPYSEGTDIVLIPECDSLRILTTYSCEMLQLVAWSTQEIFAFGSTEPASLLYDSYEDFANGDARADSHRRRIKDEEMENAVDDCLDAATNELEKLEFQKKLLQAASYGKLFIKPNVEREMDKDIIDAFSTTCKYLRVLNAIRKPNIGMPLTYLQFEIVTAEVIVQRLIHRKQHLLAIRISKYLDLAVDKALEHWAMCKIECTPRIVKDTELVHMIHKKVRSFPSFSYAKLSRAAQKRSIALAILLIEHEPRAKAQISALIDFEQYELALRKALKSLDTELIIEVMLRWINMYIYDKKLWPKLFAKITVVGEECKQAFMMKLNENSAKMISNINTSSSYYDRAMDAVSGSTTNESTYSYLIYNVLSQIFIQLLRDKTETNPLMEELLMKYLQSKYCNPEICASIYLEKHLYMNEGLGNEQKECEKYLEYATKTYEVIQRKIKQYSFDIQMCADQKRLFIFEKKFDKKLNSQNIGHSIESCVGLSCMDFIKYCIFKNDMKYADHMRQEFNISLKRYWYIIVNNLCMNGKFEDLMAYIKKNSTLRKPPPIGFLTIAEKLLEFDQKERAKILILKLSNVDEKLEWLCQMRFWSEAVEVAWEDKYLEALETIRQQCNQPEVVQRVDELLASGK